MRTAVDTNVLIALWNSDDALNTLARAALDQAAGRGALVIAAPVFAELLAGRSEAFVDGFVRDTGIEVHWNLGEPVWRLAGDAFRRYLARRGPRRKAGPRRILADFVIGAHALHHRLRLLTLDERLYRASFPELPIATL